MALTEKLCGCIEDGKPCAKKSGLSMEGWICEEETGLRQKPLGQASAAEQGQACTNCRHHNPHTSPAGDVADACNEADCNCGYYTPAQPPAAGDAQMVERMCAAFLNESGCGSIANVADMKPRMAAALDVARDGVDLEIPLTFYYGLPTKERVRHLVRIMNNAVNTCHKYEAEGYVSLADVRTAFREHFETHNDYTLGDIVHCWGQIESILAKPAEQTDEQKVEAILINALKKLSTLGNGEHPGNSIGNEIAQKALTDAIKLREELKSGKQ